MINNTDQLTEQMTTIATDSQGDTVVGKTYISDIISQDDILSWDPRQVILIDAPTGAGKTNFILNKLYPLVRNSSKLLMLSHRTAIKDALILQFANNNNNITITTYQDLEFNNTINIESFDYIICDECHFFASDAEMNPYTDISFDLIFNVYPNTKVIALTATPEPLIQYLKDYLSKQGRKLLKYNVPRDFSNLQMLKYNRTKNDSYLHDLFQSIIEKNEQAIIFCSSAEKALNLHKTYKKNSMYVCSKRNSFYSYVDTNAYHKLLKEECFDTNLLICTTTLSTGISVKSERLKHIVIDGLSDPTEIIQCIGRKRCSNSSESFTLHIQDIKNELLRTEIKKIRSRLEPVNYLLEYGTDAYLNKYRRFEDDSKVISRENINGKFKLKINHLLLMRLNYLINQYETMINYSDNGFLDYLRYQVFHENIKQTPYSMPLLHYLENNTYRNRGDKRFITNEETSELRKYIGTLLPNCKNISNINCINQSLSDEGLLFKLERFPTTLRVKDPSNPEKNKNQNYDNALRIKVNPFSNWLEEHSNRILSLAEQEVLVRIIRVKDCINNTSDVLYQINKYLKDCQLDFEVLCDNTNRNIWKIVSY